MTWGCLSGFVPNDSRQGGSEADLYRICRPDHKVAQRAINAQKRATLAELTRVAAVGGSVGSAFVLAVDLDGGFVSDLGFAFRHVDELLTAHHRDSSGVHTQHVARAVGRVD